MGNSQETVMLTKTRTLFRLIGQPMYYLPEEYVLSRFSESEGKFDAVSDPKAYLLMFHGWGGSSELLYEDAKISYLSRKLQINIIYPQGRANWLGVKSWQSSVREGDQDLKDFDTWYANRLSKSLPVILGGYSDGAAFANYVACLRSKQISGVFSYAGRLQLKDINTENKFPVVIIFNKDDRHRGSRQDLQTRAAYRNAGHPIIEKAYPGKHIRKEGWLPSSWHHDWHPDANAALEYLLRVSMVWRD